MNILVVGGGGRESALCYKLAMSEKVDKIWCAPGNGASTSRVDIKATDIPAVIEFCKKNKPDMVVVAPDDPLVLGMVDELEKIGIPAFGPRANAAIIEGSKSFSKDLMRRFNIPTADYGVFDSYDTALAYVKEKGAPIVIKADGLALGKGVTVAKTLDEAIAALDAAMRGNAFGKAGARVVIEEFMTGPEVSVLCFTDGKTLLPLPSAQDHKRAYDGDKGPNTGGMGAFSPSLNYTDEINAYCMEKIFLPTIHAMNELGRTFKGVLYFGLMLTPDGPKVVEYNARFGDPETQAVLPRLKSDLVEIMQAVIQERLSEIKLEIDERSACCIVLASGGYPKKYVSGYEISGLEEAEKSALVFHAGTKLQDGKFYTAGGRVLGVTALGDTMASAVKNAYSAADKISFTDMHRRNDIGS